MSPVWCHKHRKREADRMKRVSEDQGEWHKPLKYTGKAQMQKTTHFKLVCVTPASLHRDLLLNTWMWQEIMTTILKWRPMNLLLVCIKDIKATWIAKTTVPSRQTERLGQHEQNVLTCSTQTLTICHPQRRCDGQESLCHQRILLL